jgi:hypothetical protein
MLSILPITHPSAWLGTDMAADTSWRTTFSPAQQAEIRTALTHTRARNFRLSDITADTFPLPRCAQLLREVGDTLRDGRGFVLLRGFPIDGLAVEEVEIAYCGLCVHLGVPVTQNAGKEFFAHIKDDGPRINELARGYGTASESKFHIDLTDVVCLLCLRQAKEGGVSRVASSISVLNAVIRERPDLLPLLLEGFPWDRRDEHGPQESPVGPRIPIFSESNGLWACRYNRGFIEAVFRRNDVAVPKLACEAFDFLDALALRREHVLEMDFQPGDIQLVSNDTTLHARTAFVDYAEADRKRLLLRAWLQMEPARALSNPDLLRNAFVRYGNLGRTMAEVAAALSAVAN